jgi:CRISPR-associated RAMP protein (TIGR02581 family)
MTTEPYSFAALHNRLIICGTLVARAALRIGAGRASELTGSDLPVLRDAQGRPLIPGASLKGMLRARAEALIRAVVPITFETDFSQLERVLKDLKAVKEEDAQDKKQLQQIRRDILHHVAPDDAVLDVEQLETRTSAVQKFRRDYRAQFRQDISDSDYSNLIWKLSTMIDLTFGSPQLAGRLFLKDAHVDERFWFEQFEVRNGVAINRDTETVEQGLLYDYEVVPAGTRFHFALTLENAAAWQRGLVVLLLKPWERGEVQVGGFRSRGLGYVQLEEMNMQHITVREVADVVKLLNGGTENMSDEQMKQQVAQWIQAFEKVLRDPKLIHKPEATAEGGSDA